MVLSFHLLSNSLFTISTTFEGNVGVIGSVVKSTANTSIGKDFYLLEYNAV
jgi:hypothetical protein